VIEIVTIAARNRVAALALTPVLPETTSVGAPSVLSSRSYSCSDGLPIGANVIGHAHMDDRGVAASGRRISRVEGGKRDAFDSN
jgi:hypothetical protein